MSPLYFEFARELLALYEPPLRAPATRAKMRQALREFRELAGARTVVAQSLTPELVARWILAHQDRSPATNRSVLSSFRAACSYAVYRGYLERSPLAMRRVWIRPGPRVEPRHHTRAEISRFLEALRRRARDGGWPAERLFALAALVAFTGARKMEALCARVDDFDLERSIWSIADRRPLKTLAASQPIPLARQLVVTLERWLPRSGSIWAFPGVRRAGPWVGGPPGYRPLDALSAAAAAEGIEGLTFHSLRHSWATHAESAWGLSEPVIQRILRHTTPRTQRSYRHADLANLLERVGGITFTR